MANSRAVVLTLSGAFLVYMGYLRSTQKEVVSNDPTREFLSRQWSECTSSTLQGLSALITILGAAHLFRQSCSNRKDIDHKSYFAGGVVLTILALNPFPHARIIGAIVAVASFNLLRKPPKLLH